MKRISEGGDPKYDPTLASAFVRFLTKAAAENSMANLGRVLEDVKTDIYKVWKVGQMLKDVAELKRKQ